MALVNINFTVLAHAYVLYARALQSRIRGGTFAAPVRPALKSGTAMRTTVKSGTAFAVPAEPSTPPLTRLHFGVVSTPSIFPKVINIVLQGLLNVICYLDDIHKTSCSVEEHLHNVELLHIVYVLLYTAEYVPA